MSKLLPEKANNFRAWLKKNTNLKESTINDYVANLRLARRNKDGGGLAYADLYQAINTNGFYDAIQSYADYEAKKEAIDNVLKGLQEQNKSNLPPDIIPALNHYIEFLESQDK